jgi:hypothetical protein
MMFPSTTRRFVFLAILMVFAARPGFAAILDGPVVNPANGHTYYLLSPDTWTNSETSAESLGGHLATVRNSTENGWILNTFGGFVAPSGFIWIGLYDPTQNDGNGSQHAADFQWIDGEPITYEPWGVGEPNNDALNGGEYYVGIDVYPFNMLTPGVWNDLNNAAPGTSAYGLVEVPEPASITVLAVGIAVVLLRRRGREAHGS